MPLRLCAPADKTVHAGRNFGIRLHIILWNIFMLVKADTDFYKTTKLQNHQIVPFFCPVFVSDTNIIHKTHI